MFLCFIAIITLQSVFFFFLHYFVSHSTKSVRLAVISEVIRDICLYMPTSNVKTQME